MTNLSVNIVESVDEIGQRILRALLPQIQEYLKRAFDTTKNNIESIVNNAIINSVEYQSLLSGKLKYEFGLPDSQSRLSTILSILSQLKVVYNKPKIVKSQIHGSFIISMIEEDYLNLLSSSAAILNTEKGSQLEWLRWLLLLGDKTIIKEYAIEIGPNPRSRTGNAVMVAQTKGRWNVPPEFSGTKNNNWITRAIDSVSDEIDQLLHNALKV